MKEQTMLKGAGVLSASDRFWKNLYEWVESFVLAMAGVLLFMAFFIQQFQVFGSSMETTFHEGQRVFAINLYQSPQRGDVVLCYEPNQLTGQYEKIIIKRVIAVGGDTLDINYNTNEVLVNGNVIEEPYIKDKEFYPAQGQIALPVTIPKDHVFLMGDNRRNSKDSRSVEVGVVDNRYLLGRVVLRIFPLNTFKVFTRPE